MDDPCYHPFCKFPEEYYWRMPLWKDRDKVNSRTFLGWCMRVIEKVYLAMQTEPTILQTPPSLINRYVPPTPEHLYSMQIIIPSRPLAYDVQEELRRLTTPPLLTPSASSLPSQCWLCSSMLPRRALLPRHKELTAPYFRK